MATTLEDDEQAQGPTHECQSEKQGRSYSAWQQKKMEAGY
jgi:hypothetical protein